MTTAMTSKQRRHRLSLARLGVITTLVALVAATSVMLALHDSTLYAISESGDVYAQLIFTLFNPIRDRAPEREAERVFHLLRSGRVAQARSALSAADPPPHFVANETSYPLSAWRLVSRHDSPNHADLVYRVARGTDRRPVEPVFVELDYSTDLHSWQVSSFITAY